MEQGGISIISPPGITENSIGKPTKNIGLALRSNAGIRSAKEKLKAPCDQSVRYRTQSQILAAGVDRNQLRRDSSSNSSNSNSSGSSTLRKNF
ncbi:aquaporin-like isoform X1 [Vespula maculifrons]|uniref:Aquaporin-like isoform X1 n=1 Tax=Vespula maculifrons TaxID=7453 RepID=A0ABD2B4E3_VESMC